MANMTSLPCRDAATRSHGSSHHLAHAANPPRHGPHDVEGEVRHLVDHKAELSLIIRESSQVSLTRAVELLGASSTMDMNPIASFAPQISITLSPVTISMRPDCTIYMQEPTSPLLKTMLPALNVTDAPIRCANIRMSISLPF